MRAYTQTLSRYDNVGLPRGHGLLTNRQTDRQTGRQANRQTDRQANELILVCIFIHTYTSA